MENTETNTQKEQLTFEEIKDELNAIVQALDGYYKDVNLAHVPDIVALAKSYGIYDNLYKIYEVSQDKDISGAISVEVAKMGGAAAGAWAGMQIGANIPVLIPQVKGILIILGGAAWGIADAVSGLFGSAQGYDPLVLDMDGDGIETLQINTNLPIFFDYDNDGIKTATGWVKSDDALLVLDRNANGTIDNGSELFGDQTIVNGVKATDGFAALSAEDSNSNGIFDANDTNFNNVRLWQDLNQNGISEANELKTLSEAQIVSISLSSTQTNIAVNGGIQTAEGTFTKADGTTGESANYIFDSNTFYREFTDTIPLTEAASALPEMQGSGTVRDLREAVSMLVSFIKPISNNSLYKANLQKMA